MTHFQDKANFIWQVADDILRGTFKAHEYGDVIRPFVVLRRLDCVLNGQKDEIISTYNAFKDSLEPDRLEQVVLNATDGLNFYNMSDYDLERLTQDAKNILAGRGEGLRALSQAPARASASFVES